MRVDALVQKYPVRIREVTLGTLFLLLLIFYFSPRFYSKVITNSYDVVKQIETFDIPQTQQIKIPDPPARPSVPMASEDEFFDEDITIEDTNADNLILRHHHLLRKVQRLNLFHMTSSQNLSLR